MTVKCFFLYSFLLLGGESIISQGHAFFGPFKGITDAIGNKINEGVKKVGDFIKGVPHHAKDKVDVGVQQGMNHIHKGINHGFHEIIKQITSKLDEGLNFATEKGLDVLPTLIKKSNIETIAQNNLMPILRNLKPQIVKLTDKKASSLKLSIQKSIDEKLSDKAVLNEIYEKISNNPNIPDTLKSIGKISAVLITPELVNTIKKRLEFAIDDNFKKVNDIRDQALQQTEGILKKAIKAVMTDGIKFSGKLASKIGQKELKNVLSETLEKTRHVSHYYFCKGYEPALKIFGATCTKHEDILGHKAWDEKLWIPRKHITNFDIQNIINSPEMKKDKENLIEKLKTSFQ